MNNIKMIDLYLAYTRLTNPELESYRQNMADYFCLDEQEEYSRFKVPKRQNEWISSRIITKKMVSQIQNCSESCFQDISIRKEASGRPYIFINGQGRLGGGFSLSHSNGFVFCGYSPSSALNYGLDLEKIEERKLEFIEDYFTPQEIEQYNHTESDRKNDFTTLIWSAKEATLKALGRGLAIDTRNVNVIITDPRRDFEGWNNCDVIINTDKRRYQVLWQKVEGFIRTISFPDGEPVRLIKIDVD